jgi:hypothetical protein
MTTPLGLLLTLILALMVFCLSRRMAAVATVAAICYLTEGQPLELGGFHFTSIRFVLLTGFLRLLARGELRQLRLNTIDRYLIAYASVILTISTLRLGTTQGFIYEIGILYNVLLSYFVFRGFLRGEGDCREFLGKFALVIVPFALLMVFQSATGHNLFWVFGGVSESSWIRDGHIRSQCSFRNPITAGAFGATFAMLFAGMVLAGGRSRNALVGLVASVLIVICAGSSGPIMGLVLGFVVLACWPLRRQSKKICWGIVALLIGLQLVMKAPVWFLLGRVSDLVGGGGYHRAVVIDQAVNRFSSWWFVGLDNTSDWFPYQLSDGQSDITNKFVSDGLDGGLLGLMLSVMLVARCFQRLGAAMRKNQGGEPGSSKLMWGLGSTLVGTIGILFSVTYFDQMYVMWYFVLACIAGLDTQKNAGVQKALRRNQETTRRRFAPDGQLTAIRRTSGAAMQ